MPVQLCKRERRRSQHHFTFLSVTGQSTQQHLVAGLKQPLDTPASTRLSRLGVDQADFEIGSDLLQMV
jgi:hypothetical protein